MSARPRAGALLIAALALALPASAAPEEGVGAGKLQVRLENLPDQDGRMGAFFSAAGETPPLIDGARLRVTLSAIGRSRDFPVRITRAVVKDNRYEVSYPWKDRTLAPLVYEVKVELALAQQPKSIQNWIMTEYGYAPSHQEVIDKLRVPLGTREERVEFAVKNIDTIKGMVLSLEERRATIAAMAVQPVAEVEGGREQLQSLTVDLIAYRREVDAYFTQYVILLEQGFYKRILNHLRNLDRILRDYGRGSKKVGPKLEKLQGTLATSAQLIEQYSPVPTTKPLIPEDELEPDGGAEPSGEESDDAPGAEKKE
jgi:hypothetical protein